jgi:chromosome segregation ATPase
MGPLLLSTTCLASRVARRRVCSFGEEVLCNAFSGFNTSLFAYGQTGSGKSHTMLGGLGADEEGLIPRISRELFRRIGVAGAPVAHVVVSYLEIYNEKVRDLLNFSVVGDAPQQQLRVRNNPKTGPYVEGLTRLAVSSHEEVLSVMREGAQSRSVASTNMNEVSSRSHAIFTIMFTQQSESGGPTLASRIDLVDLAGSERANKTGAQGQRLREGAAINQSLSTLGKVIFALADVAAAANSSSASSTSSSAARKSVNRRQTMIPATTATTSAAANYIPYRDSTLTWLLKDSLGGNAKTIMLATISSAAVHAEETMSTLRYAERAKSIQNRAVVNEDPNEKAVRELQNEVERLRSLMDSAQSKRTEEELRAKAEQVEQLRVQLAESESMMKQLNVSWEDKLRATKELMAKLAKARKQMGLAVTVDKKLPCLINLNEDRVMSEVLVYYLRAGETRAGSASTAPSLDAVVGEEEPEEGWIFLGGVGIGSHHCTFVNQNGQVAIDPVVVGGAFVNGKKISERTWLSHGDRVVLGAHHVFRFNDPAGASAAVKTGAIDWNFALRELAIKQRLIPEELETSLTPVKQKAGAASLGTGEEAAVSFSSPGDKAEQAMEEAVVEVEREIESMLENKTKLIAQYQKQLDIELSEAESLFASKEQELKQLAEEHKERFSRLRERRFRNAACGHTEEAILHAVTLVQDANARCQEMGRDLHFELKLRPRTNGKSDLVVEAFEESSGKTAFFSTEELADRLSIMMGPAPRQEMSPFASPASKQPIRDPFALDMDQEVPLGKSFLYLKPLLRLSPIVYAAPILDTASRDRRGEMSLTVRWADSTLVRLQTVPENQVEAQIACSNVEVLVQIHRASLSLSNYKTVRCAFSLWDSDVQSTDLMSEANVVSVDFECKLSFSKAGLEFVEFLKHSFVSFDVLVGSLPRECQTLPTPLTQQHRSVEFSLKIDVQQQHQDLVGGFASVCGKRRHWNDAPTLLKLKPDAVIGFHVEVLDLLPKSHRLEQWLRAELTVVSVGAGPTAAGPSTTGRKGAVANSALNTTEPLQVVAAEDGSARLVLSSTKAAILSRVTPKHLELQLRLSVWLSVTPLAEAVSVHHVMHARVAEPKASWKPLPARMLRVLINPGHATQAAVSNLMEEHKDAAFALDTLLKAERIRQELATSAAVDESASVASTTPLSSARRTDDKRRHSVLHLTMLEQSLQKTKDRKSIAPTPASQPIAQAVSVKELRSTACDFQGWMKMSKSGGALWKKLYFVLRRPMLSYWSRKEDFQLYGLPEHGTIDLLDALLDPSPREGRAFSFSLQLADKTVWLQASDSTSHQKWMFLLGGGAAGGGGGKSLGVTPSKAKSPSILRNLATELDGVENTDQNHKLEVTGLQATVAQLQLQLETAFLSSKDLAEKQRMSSEANLELERSTLLAEFEAEKKKFTEQEQAWQQRLCLLEQQIEVRNKQIVDDQATIESLSDQLDRSAATMKCSLSSMEKEVQTVQAENRSLKDQAEVSIVESLQKNDLIDALKKELEASRKEAESLRVERIEELHELSSKAATFQVESAAQIESLKSNLNAAIAAVAEKDAVIGTLKTELDVAVAEKDAVIGTLKTELDGMITAVAEKDAVIGTLKTELDGMITAVAEKDAVIGTLKTELDVAVAEKDAVIGTLKTELDGMITAVAEKDAVIGTLKTELNVAVAEKDAVIGALKTELDGMITAVAEKDAVIGTLKTELNVAVAEKDAVIGALKTELDGMITAVAEKDAVIGTLKTELDGMITAVAEKDAVIGTLKTELDVAVAEKDAVIGTLKTELDGMITAVAEKDAVIGTLKTELDGSIAASASNFAVLQTLNADLQCRIESLMQDSGSKQAEIDALTKDLVSERQTVILGNQKIDLLQSKLSGAEDWTVRIAEKEASLDLLRSKLAEAEAAFVDSQKELGLSCCELAASLSKISVLEAQVLDVRAQLDLERSSWTTLQQENRIAVEDLRCKMMSLEESNAIARSELEARLSEKSGQLVVAEQKCDIVEQRMAELAEKNAQSSREIGELRGVIATMQEAAKFAAQQAQVAQGDAAPKFSKESFAALLKERDALHRANDAQCAYAANLTIEINHFRRNHSVAELTLERKLQSLQSQFKLAREDCQKLEKERRDQALLARLDDDSKAIVKAEQMRNEAREKQLRDELDAIAKSYFLSFAISVKMNLSARGKFANVNVHELFEEAVQHEIAWRDYPDFINSKLQQ